MKVILKKDIPNVGQAGQVKSVSDGYARNYLLPHQLATIASAEAITRAGQKPIQRASQDDRRTERAEAAVRKLTGTVLIFQEKANDAGHLFASVNAAAIAKSIHRHAGIKVTADDVQLDQPIKQVGRQTVSVKYDGQTAQCTIDVQAKP
jgi:large subunit ribosomal protein L9